MMRLACKAATPMMQALSSASRQLSIAEDEADDEAGSAEAMNHVSGNLCVNKVATFHNSVCSWSSSCSSSSW
jgi:hypothetical protein